MGDWGMKITRDGADVTSTDDRDYVLSSKYKTLKSKARATTVLTRLANQYTATKVIAHGLGYAPIILAMAEMNPGKWYSITGFGYAIIDADPGSAYQIGTKTDSTNITFSMYSVKSYGVDMNYNITYYTIIDER